MRVKFHRKFNLLYQNMNKRKSQSLPQENQNYGSMDLRSFYPKNERQREFWSSMEDNTVSIALGCAGTGKTLLSLWYGISMVSQRIVDKIVYIRSDVGMDHQRGGRNGALKGNYQEKFSPLLAPLGDNLRVIMKSQGAADYLVNKGIIEPLFLEDARGRSFNGCFVIVDEAQNVTPEQVKTCLTRIGEGTKMALTGDTAQSDHYIIRQNDGLSDAARRLHNLEGVGITRFGVDDIVRNPLIKSILTRYDQPSSPYLSIAA